MKVLGVSRKGEKINIPHMKAYSGKHITLK